MIFRGSDGFISITNKGREFIHQYGQLINLIESAGLWDVIIGLLKWIFKS
jgi:hypothetical protein